MNTTPEIEKSITFAEKAHGSQKRKYTGEPYINHCKNVAEIIYTHTNSELLYVAAILHDTVEDTPVTIEDIDKNFGVGVSKIVEELTDVYTHEAFPNIRRKERKLLECYRLSKVGAFAKSIKLVDLIDNTLSIVEHDPSFAKVYLKEKEELLNALKDSCTPGLMERAILLLRESKKKLGIL